MYQCLPARKQVKRTIISKALTSSLQPPGPPFLPQAPGSGLPHSLSSSIPQGKPQYTSAYQVCAWARLAGTVVLRYPQRNWFQDLMSRV